MSRTSGPATLNAGPAGVGDPAMARAIPSEQYRNAYTFLTPETYSSSFVSVGAPTGTRVEIDGRLITGFTPVGESGVSTARIPVSPGVHHIEGRRAFGVLVYGFGTYTSYLYPGGLDFIELNPPF